VSLHPLNFRYSKSDALLFGVFLSEPSGTECVDGLATICDDADKPLVIVIDQLDKRFGSSIEVA
jgi:hypothetical protein